MEARRSVGAVTITVDTETSSATHQVAVAAGKTVRRRTQGTATTGGRVTRRPDRRRDNHGNPRHRDIRDLAWVFRRRRLLRRTALTGGIRMGHTAVGVGDTDSIKPMVRQPEDTTAPTKAIPVADEVAVVGDTKAEEATTGPAEAAEAAMAAVVTTTDRKNTTTSTYLGTRDVFCQERNNLMNKTAWMPVPVLVRTNIGYDGLGFARHSVVP